MDASGLIAGIKGRRVVRALIAYAILVFAVLPALKSELISSALIYGALFGALAYATYDLTNYATLRNWTLLISVIDVAWGAFVSAAAAAVAYYASRAAGPWLGLT